MDFLKKLGKNNRLALVAFLFGILTTLAFFVPDSVLAFVALVSLAFAYYEFVFKRRPFVSMELAAKKLEGGQFLYQLFSVFKNVGSAPGNVRFNRAELHIGNQVFPTPANTVCLLQPGEAGRMIDVGFLTQEVFDSINNDLDTPHTVKIVVEIEFKSFSSDQYTYKSNYQYQIKKSGAQLQLVIISEETT